ncbi:MAG: hypothetical protein HYV76_03070 [Candidatus Vogelbacteria bacterium]|nr:hypothetical protein [Candidatus Vogelbacteria bacterium]
MPTLPEVCQSLGIKEKRLKWSHGAELNYIVDQFNRLPQSTRSRIAQSLVFFSQGDSSHVLDELGQGLVDSLRTASPAELARFMNEQVGLPDALKVYYPGLTQGLEGIKLIIRFCSQYLRQVEPDDWQIEKIDLPA